MVGNKPHQDRVMACLQAIEPNNPMLPEVSIPQASLVIDGLLRVGEAGEGWGVLRPWVRHRTVVIEHWSSPPDLDGLTNGHLKLAYMALQQRQEPRRYGDQAPLLLLLSVGMPKKALKSVSRPKVPVMEGILRSEACAMGQSVLVDIKGLPRQDGTSILRLLKTPRDTQEIKDNLDGLQQDMSLSDAFRQYLAEMIMNNPNFIPTEKKLTYTSIYQEARAEGHMAGFHQGVNEGKAEGIVQGKAEGIAQGKAEGIVQGKAEGIVQGKAEGIAQGKVEGIAQGKAEGKAEGIAQGQRLTMLELVERLKGREARESLEAITDLNELQARALALLA
jgi:hypothetical protein